jgi:hypothetical protein
MAVRWTKINETSTVGDLPTNAANTYQVGVTSGGGLVEFLTIKYDLTFAATPVAASEVSSLINDVRIVGNGETVHDFVASFASNATDQASQYGYMINSIGGRSVEEPSTTPAVRLGYINIPLGRNLPAGVNRWEITFGTVAAAAAITSGSLQFWLKYNDNCQRTTLVTPATSFQSSASQEQVVINVPQNVPAGAVVTSLMVTNDAAADELNGIRINALSDFSISPSQYRADNGDLLGDGATMFNAGNTATSLTRISYTLGALNIPCYGMTGGNLTLAVDSSAATTRRYQPIMTWPVGGKSAQEVKQTQASVGNTATAQLKNTLQ